MTSTLFKNLNPHNPKATFYENDVTRHALGYIKEKLAIEEEEWFVFHRQNIQLRNKKYIFEIGYSELYHLVLGIYNHVLKEYALERGDTKALELLCPILDSHINGWLKSGSK